MTHLSQEQLKAALHYDPITGHFIWISKISRKVVIGKRAGATNGDSGYRRLSLFGVKMHEHQLAFLYMTGRVPDMIDHRDNDRANNIWANLREATYPQNLANRDKSCINTSGFMGVSFNKRLGRWHAQITANRQRYHIGYFDNPTDAGEAYKRKSVQLMGDFAFHMSM